MKLISKTMTHEGQASRTLWGDFIDDGGLRLILSTQSAMRELADTPEMMTLTRKELRDLEEYLQDPRRE